MTTIGRNILLTGSSLGAFVESVGQQGGQETLKTLKSKVKGKTGLCSPSLHPSVQSGASYLSQGFEDNVLGSSSG